LEERAKARRRAGRASGAGGGSAFRPVRGMGLAAVADDGDGNGHRLGYFASENAPASADIILGIVVTRDAAPARGVAVAIFPKLADQVIVAGIGKIARLVIDFGRQLEGVGRGGDGGGDEAESNRQQGDFLHGAAPSSGRAGGRAAAPVAGRRGGARRRRLAESGRGARLRGMRSRPSGGARPHRPQPAASRACS